MSGGVGHPFGAFEEAFQLVLRLRDGLAHLARDIHGDGGPVGLEPLQPGTQPFHALGHGHLAPSGRGRAGPGHRGLEAGEIQHGVFPRRFQGEGIDGLQDSRLIRHEVSLSG
jgi:hypothetical protein